MRTTKKISLNDLLPSNLRSDSVVANAGFAIDPQLHIVAESIRMSLVFSRLDELNSLQLDHLAVQFHVAAWNSFWSREQKLAVIKATVETKRHRGTVKAVKSAVSSLVSPFNLTEWWQTTPKGAPYTFGIEIPLDEIGRDLTLEDQEDIASLVYEAKSIRSHNTLTLKRCFSTPIKVGGSFIFCTYVRLTGTPAPVTTEIRIPSGFRPVVYKRL